MILPRQITAVCRVRFTVALSAALLAAPAFAQTGPRPGSRPATPPAPPPPAAEEPARPTSPSGVDLESEARKPRAGQIGAPAPGAEPGQPAAATDASALVGVVIAIEGANPRAEAAIGDAPFAALTVDQKLPAGTRIRTGKGTSVVIRLGLNATARVQPQSRVTIDELAETGDTLKSTVGLEWGDVDLRVDKVGKANDFSVVTPTATLAVRGTNFAVRYDAIDGLQVMGAETNDFRAIEVSYVNRTKAVALSKGNLGGLQDPAFTALEGTLERPNEGTSTAGWATRVAYPLQMQPIYQDTDMIVQVRRLPAANTVREFSGTLRGDPPLGGGPVP